MLLTLLSLAVAHPPGPPPPPCERDFMEAVFPGGLPHPPPPLGPLLAFAWDTNGDGTLDARERAALQKDQEARCDALDEILVVLDADGDGRISSREREDGLTALFGPPPPRPRPGELPPPLRHRFDTDGDGTLSEAENEAARTTIRARFRDGLPPVPPASSNGEVD